MLLLAKFNYLKKIKLNYVSILFQTEYNKDIENIL